MPSIDAAAARDFALSVVRRLRKAGYEALWAGGCVRDQLLGLVPKDYDVATNATPDQIRDLFGRRRTLAVGAKFGVIAVRGPRGAGQVEVATFRRDATYSDGRHPDSVSFSDAHEDAARRDFTINGLFLDPLTDAVIDYVGGEADLRQRIIRAIGDAHQRLDEDKLRMLRAVRFATTFNFRIEPQTSAAVRAHAAEIVQVSAERIAEELRRMLVHPHRRRAVELLRDTCLLAQLVPETHAVVKQPNVWRAMLEILDALRQPTVAVSLAALLRWVVRPEDWEPARNVCQRWKLSNEETTGVMLCLQQEMPLRSARCADWPTLQRMLIHKRIEETLTYSAAVAQVLDGSTADIDYCRAKLALPPAELNPPPLLTGNDLREMGIPGGPIYKQLLYETRNAQLNKVIRDNQEAREFARRCYEELQKQ